MAKEWNIDEIAGEFQLDVGPHEVLKQFKTNGKDKEDIPISCFNYRYVDGFIINAARAVFYEDIPSDLPTGKKDIINVMKISGLTDKDDLHFLLRIIGYSNQLRNAKSKEEKAASHKIIVNLKRCREIVEKYFQGNWNDPGRSLKVKILEQDSPDLHLIREIEPILEKAKELEKEEETEE